MDHGGGYDVGERCDVCYLEMTSLGQMTICGRDLGPVLLSVPPRSLAIGVPPFLPGDLITMQGFRIVNGLLLGAALIAPVALHADDSKTTTTTTTTRYYDSDSKDYHQW